MRLICSLAALVLLGVGTTFGDAPRTPPDVVFILVDDLRWDDLGCTGHPWVKTPHIDRIAREGMRFDSAFCTVPLCSPSRASFLTGLYPRAHGIIDNVNRSPQSHRLPTFPQNLQAAGYRTAYVGKWHMGNDDSPRPGFDRWVSMPGQGKTWDPDLNIDGRRIAARGYVTDLLADHAVEFVGSVRDQPLCLYFAHKALHPELTQFDDGTPSDPSASRFIPAPRHENLYADQPIPRRPTYGQPPQGKPALERSIGDLPPLGPETVSSDKVIRDRLRMLQSVDDSVGRLIEALEQAGRLDNTLFIVTSDHGYFYGEHGLSVERRLAYEESIRIPLLVRYPPLVKPGSSTPLFALSVDLAPTILELAGAEPGPMHGRSLVEILAGGDEPLRTDLLVEYFSDTVFPRIHRMGYQAVRTDRWKYIRYTELDGMDEVYDLQNDPYERDNLLIGSRVPSDVLSDLQSRLERLVRETGPL